jgi:hypothetical protein
MQIGFQKYRQEMEDFTIEAIGDEDNCRNDPQKGQHSHHVIRRAGLVRVIGEEHGEAV